MSPTKWNKLWNPNNRSIYIYQFPIYKFQHIVHYKIFNCTRMFIGLLFFYVSLWTLFKSQICLVCHSRKLRCNNMGFCGNHLHCFLHHIHGNYLQSFLHPPHYSPIFPHEHESSICQWHTSKYAVPCPYITYRIRYCFLLLITVICEWLVVV